MMMKFNFYILIYTIDMMMFMLMMLPSNLFNFHPLTLSLILCFYLIFLTFKLNLMTNSFWYSYILFLVMIGGLMILFMYFTSLMNNELFFLKLKYNMNLILKMIILFIVLTLFYKEYKFIYYYLSFNYFELKNFILFFNFNYKNLFKNLMMDYSMMMNMYMIMYLFLIMLCMVTICNKISFPLRQMLMKYE
uniref:NADH dehydrogenase subunit 6 n=1 Tax=Virgulibracon endoxylaphagus TaxID=2933211 RepID=A0A8T9JGC9_9HYME|nr:NADH dehydrogenase subunit 6 [Virgulibracon endoxylaphagus]UOK09634.1 NADH dehydrogenase subunit 6 [Virgulibracon endoxylaphagus]